MVPLAKNMVRKEREGTDQYLTNVLFNYLAGIGYFDYCPSLPVGKSILMSMHLHHTAL